jgi:hypothetical protein
MIQTWLKAQLTGTELKDDMQLMHNGVTYHPIVHDIFNDHFLDC